MRTPSFYLRMKSRLSMHVLEDGQRWMQLFMRHCPAYIPDTWGFPEPYRTPFDPKAPPANLVFGEGGFQQKGRQTLGFFFKPSGYNRVHSAFTLIVEPKNVNWPAIRNFIDASLETMELDYVEFHTEADPSSTTHRLRKCIQRVNWFTYLGPPYMRLMGELIRGVSVPGVRVDAMEAGVGLQLTGDPQDVLKRPELIEYRAAQVRAQLPGVFRNPDDALSERLGYVAPAFDDLQPYPGMKFHQAADEQSEKSEGRAVPGMIVREDASVIYFADTKGRSIRSQLTNLTRYADPPQSTRGGVGELGCKITTPDRQIFHAISLHGDIEGWRKDIECGARGLHLVLAKIENGQFVVSDGRAFSLTTCAIEFY